MVWQFVTLLALSWSIATGTTYAHEGRGPTSLKDYELDKVSANIYVLHDVKQIPHSERPEIMNNPAAILTKNGVIVVDPGSSAAVGKQLLQKLRKVSAKPVIAILNTHVHGDHWLGNSGIRDRYANVPIYAHERMIARAKAGEGADWMKLFNTITKGKIKGTQAIIPNKGLKGGETLTLDGVTLRVHHAGHAHTDNDLMFEVVDDKALFFGDIVGNRYVANSVVPQDASFKGSIAAIQSMLKGPATTFIPGHGRTGGREVPEATLRFLEKLRASVSKYYKQGMADYEMKDAVIKDMNEYRDWTGFNELGRVITYVYQEVEKENF